MDMKASTRPENKKPAPAKPKSKKPSYTLDQKIQAMTLWAVKDMSMREIAQVLELQSEHTVERWKAADVPANWEKHREKTVGKQIEKTTEYAMQSLQKIKDRLQGNYRTVGNAAVKLLVQRAESGEMDTSTAERLLTRMGDEEQKLHLDTKEVFAPVKTVSSASGAIAGNRGANGDSAVLAVFNQMFEESRGISTSERQTVDAPTGSSDGVPSTKKP